MATPQCIASYAARNNPCDFDVKWASEGNGQRKFQTPLESRGMKLEIETIHPELLFYQVLCSLCVKLEIQAAGYFLDLGAWSRRQGDTYLVAVN